MTNIFDIAKIAGVSKTTVSKVINNQYGVSSGTREKVLAAADKLGYTPNLLARSLVKSRSNVIGVVFNSFTSPVYMQMAGLLEKYAEALNYSLIFCSSNQSLDTKRKYINYMSSGSADGIVMFGSSGDDREDIKKLTAAQYPIVSIEDHFDDLKINNVLINNVDGGRKAVNYLAKLNHREIVHIAGNLQERVASDRMNGYIMGMQENKLEIKPQNIIYTDAKIGCGKSAAKALLKLIEKPTAVFAFNDIIAYEVIGYLQKEGYSVPKDFSFIGFDNIITQLNFIPSNIRLTSLEQPMEKVASAAIEILVNNIEDRELQPKEVLFDTELVEGNSCSKL